MLTRFYEIGPTPNSGNLLRFLLHTIKHLRKVTFKKDPKTHIHDKVLSIKTEHTSQERQQQTNNSGKQISNQTTKSIKT